MIQALSLILGCQLLGEIAARGLALPAPGPVLGMILLWGLMHASARIAALVIPVGQGILRHLALLFVPAGVGIVGHLNNLGAQALGMGAAILGSTVLAMLAGAGAFVLVAKLLGSTDD